MPRNRGRRLGTHGLLVAVAGLLLHACDNAAEIPAILLPPVVTQRPAVALSNPSSAVSVLAQGSPIFVEFDRPMNEERTARAFSLSGPSVMGGGTRWEANRMLFEPERPLALGGSFLLRITSAATSRDGVALDPEFLVHFRHGVSVGGAPVVVSTAPADNEQNAPENSELRITFDTAMDRPSVEKAIQTSPSVEGSFRWDSDRTIVLTPRFALQTGTTYSVTVATAALSSTGVALSTPHSFRFRAGTDFVQPTVLAVSQVGVPGDLADGSLGVSKDAQFVLEFSEAMDGVDTAAAASLQRVDNEALVAGQWSWNPGFTRLTFAPERPLEPEHWYRVAIGTTSRDQNGNSLAAPERRDFRVDATGGLLRSGYLQPVDGNKDLPAPTEPLTLSSSVFSVLTLPASAGALGDSLRLRLRFSLPLRRGSIPANVSFRKLAGTGSTGSLTAIRFAPVGADADRELVLEFEGIGNNDYELRLSGGRDGVLSTTAAGETSTFLAEDLLFYLRIHP